MGSSCRRISGWLSPPTLKTNNNSPEILNTDEEEENFIIISRLVSKIRHLEQQLYLKHTSNEKTATDIVEEPTTPTPTSSLLQGISNLLQTTLHSSIEFIVQDLPTPSDTQEEEYEDDEEQDIREKEEGENKQQQTTSSSSFSSDEEVSHATTHALEIATTAFLRLKSQVAYLQAQLESEREAKAVLTNTVTRLKAEVDGNRGKVEKITSQLISENNNAQRRGMISALHDNPIFDE
jgi:hypothetical protein